MAHLPINRERMLLNGIIVTSVCGHDFRVGKVLTVHLVDNELCPECKSKALIDFAGALYAFEPEREGGER
ncbi:MAG: hypothetical protein WC663_03995 [Patescibacteria group bacterium]